MFMARIATHSEEKQAPHFASDEARWQAVRERDRAADGVFFYGVKTTGVFCRPSCAARLAKRENVSFHSTAADARRAGLRPCKRCRPEQQDAERVEARAVSMAAKLIEDAVAREEPVPSLEALATKAGYSPFHFHRMFRQSLGLTPKAFAKAARNRKLAGDLEKGASVTAAIHAAGFSSSSRFYESAANDLGMAPRLRQKGGEGQRIAYAVTETTLGPLLVAATEKGVCAVEFGASGASLESSLKRRFPRADLVTGDRSFGDLVAQVVRHVETPHEARGLPLDVQGTAFQERVWQALRAIPLGETASYRDIAQKIGEPRASRAVAMACASNPVAVVIPCHRVVRANGDLSGYRWGTRRKETLLSREFFKTGERPRG